MVIVAAAAAAAAAAAVVVVPPPSLPPSFLFLKTTPSRSVRQTGLSNRHRVTALEVNKHGSGGLRSNTDQSETFLPGMGRGEEGRGGGWWWRCAGLKKRKRLVAAFFVLENTG